MTYHPFRNIGLKGLSVGLALLLWATVSREQVVERGLRVPLEFQNMPELLEIVNESPPTVDVRIRGASGVVSRLGPGDVVVALDLRAARPGQRLFHLLTDEVRRPFGVEVVQITPATITIEFEAQATRVVPIVPAVEGEPAPGYVLGDVAAEPAVVEVIGPESRIRELTHATTEPVLVEGAVSTVIEEVAVGVADHLLRLKQRRSASVTAEIQPVPLEHPVADVPVRYRNGPPAPNVQVRPGQVLVVVRGARDVVDELAPGAVEAFVDLAGLGTGSYNLPVHVEAETDVTIDRIDPALVRVTIR